MTEKREKPKKVILARGQKKVQYGAVKPNQGSVRPSKPGGSGGNSGGGAGSGKPTGK
jgi:hypothetical protein